MEYKNYTQKKIEANLNELYNKEIQIYGWLKRIRQGNNGEIIFIDIYDGTMQNALMCLAEKEKYFQTESLEEINKDLIFLKYEELTETIILSPGSSVLLQGYIKKSPENTLQEYEFNVEKLHLLGGIEDFKKYPIQKSSEKNLLSLRKYPFLRMRTQLIQSLFRIRSNLLFSIHKFFNENDVICTDPNIITSSDCEGAGEVFKINSDIFGKEKNIGLTVSSQLPLEALATGFKSVYTCQKSFRAEKSDTSKHLAEFLHIEYESYFITLEELLNFTENFIKVCLKETLKKSKTDFDFLESKFSCSELHGNRIMVENLLKKDFVRIKHSEAVDLIQKLVKEKTLIRNENNEMKRVKVKEWPDYESDLSSEHEKILVSYFNNFVFVTHWPLKIKSFYMKQCEDGSNNCESFDLLAPKVGEMFGGSMREWRYANLINEIKKREMDIEPISWYLELRKNGSAPHGGWGLGFDRMLMFITGVSSVRDIVPLPVYYQHCPY